MALRNQAPSRKISASNKKNMFESVNLSVFFCLYRCVRDRGTRVLCAQSNSVALFFRYDYYTISSEDSGDVTITTTVTANPIGVWTWIGRDYQPVDGNSDWNQVGLRLFVCLFHRLHGDARFAFFFLPDSTRL